MSIGAVERMACRWLIPLLAPEISGREDAVINRARFSNEANSLALRFWDKSNDFTHDHRSIKLRSSFNRSIWVFDATFEVLQSVTTEQKLVTGANVGNQLFRGSTVQLSRDCCSQVVPFSINSSGNQRERNKRPQRGTHHPFELVLCSPLKRKDYIFFVDHEGLAVALVSAA